MANAAAVHAEMTVIYLPLGDEAFMTLCAQNRDLRFESTSTGELLIMAPTSSETGARNAELLIDVGVWNRVRHAGRVFGSSTGFTLPNGARRSPDVAWVSQARWDGISEAEKRGMARICPDFVLELRSPSDALPRLQDKMREYLDNGARLGWLIDPSQRVVYIYRPGQAVERLEAPESLAGEDILPGLVLPLQTLWTR